MSPLSRPPHADLPATSGDGSPLATSPRELRAQMVQRLQVGLFGLSLMLLLVGLANIIMEQARRNDALVAQSAMPIAAGSAPVQAAGDPLADIGVVPSPEAAASKRNLPRGAAH